VALVRKRTIPTERPPLVGEVSANFWVAPENVGLQKEQKYHIFACHTCNEMRLCDFGIHIRKLATRNETIAQTAETRHRNAAFNF
jgi:hypothetical protein